MEYQKKDNRGGARVGAGRPRKSYKSISVNITMEANAIYQSLKNKSDFVSKAIIYYEKRNN